MNLILIHGQGRSPFSMTLLGRRLRQRGFRVHYFGYVSFYEPFEQITERFTTTIRGKFGGEPYAIVAHSMGGIIARAALPQLSEHPPRHLVMLAPPNRPPRMARLAMRIPIYNWFTGDCGRKLVDDTFYKSLPRPTVPTTIIAGGSGPRGRFSPFGQAINDWVLAVEETELGGEAEVILAETNHAFIMNSRDVARLVGELVDGSQ
jgi:pimeloyl-ACP methyl ester carboxylesterase